MNTNNVVPFPSERQARSQQNAAITRACEEQMAGPTRAEVLERLNHRLERTATFQLQIVELVLVAIARGAA
jgi:hypothetical protein